MRPAAGFLISFLKGERFPGSVSSSGSALCPRAPFPCGVGAARSRWPRWVCAQASASLPSSPGVRHVPLPPHSPRSLDQQGSQARRLSS